MSAGVGKALSSMYSTHVYATGWLDAHGNIVPDPKLGWKTLPEGAATTVVAAFDPSISSRSDLRKRG